MRAGLIRILPFLLLAALGLAPAGAQEPGNTDHTLTRERLDRLRELIEQVERSGADPTPFALVVLRASAETLSQELQGAREAEEAGDEPEMTQAQVKEARRLLNRLTSLLLLPAVHGLEEQLDELEAREAPITREDLAAFGPDVRELRRRTKEVAEQLDPEVQRKPDGLAEAQDVLRRYSKLDYEVAARDLLEKAKYWETLSPPPTAEELEPVFKETRDLEERFNWDSQDPGAIPDATAERVRTALARAGTLELIPYTESLMPVLVELESRETALTDAELARAEETADELYERIEAVRPGMLAHYDPDAPPACVRARRALRRLVSLELQPHIERARGVVSDLENREQVPSEEELQPLRAGAQQLRELVQGFEERKLTKSAETEPDLVQQSRELLWRFALVDLERSVTDLEPLVAELEAKPKGPSAEELAQLNAMAEKMQPKLRDARGKKEAQPSVDASEEPTPEAVVKARDLMRRAGALQPRTLAAAEEERDAPVTTPFLSWFRFYGSLRLRTFLSPGGFSRIDDETSRIGLRAQKKIGERFEIFGRIEISINPLEIARDGEDLGRDPDGDRELFPRRLTYIGAETPWGTASLGKVWSTYWNVAVFSDQLPAYTGLTTGTFNNGDGSVSGTGRTSQTIQYRNVTGGFTYAGQMQIRNLTSNDQPVADTIGGSTIFSRQDGIDIGGAFSIVRDGVDNPDSDQPKRGDRAFIAGARIKNDLRYFGATLAYTENHYRDDLGVFFNGIGFEVYADYLVHKKIRLRFVADGLFPLSGYDGDYRLIYLVAGASYDILKSLRVFVLPRVTLSKNSDGSDRGDHSVAILLLWNF
jgi:predicted porin/cob(I)alamin adenosyltransferase